MRVRLINGITYTKGQVRQMFDSQLETTKKLVLPEDRKLLINWLNEFTKRD